ALLMSTRSIPSSPAHASSRWRMATAISSVSALSASGRSSVMTPARPRWSKRTPPAAVMSQAQYRSRHDETHDFVGPLENLVHAHVAQVAFERKVPQVAVTAVQLQRLVHHLESDIGRKPLRHRRGPC